MLHSALDAGPGEPGDDPPLRDEIDHEGGQHGQCCGGHDDVAQMRQRYTDRFTAYTAKLDERTRQRVEGSRAESATNIAHAAQLRSRFQ